MISLLTGGLSLLTSGVKGFFGVKESQIKTMNKAVEIVSDINATDEAKSMAAAKIITAEIKAESWLTRNWRPLFMVFFGLLIGARWFGYMPPNMTESEIMEIYGLFKIGIGGYIGGRTIEKILTNLPIKSILEKIVNKK